MKKILIVEDEKPELRALSDKFNSEGFEVVEASTGKEGLEKALSIHPDIILLDLILPEMDGVTVLKKLREDEFGKKTPVIILSNLSDDQAVAEALEAGVHGYLVKTDWTLGEVVKKVREKLEK